MLHAIRSLWRTHSFLVAFALLVTRYAAGADSQILGELQLVHTGGTERLAGVWIDGQYLGYLSELKGSKKILLMPGEHDVVVRLVGYQDFSRRVVVEPRQKQSLPIALQLDPNAPRPPATTAEVRTLVRPKRAAVFVDGTYAGHVDEFDSPGQAMILPSGKHRIRMALSGYQDFETEVDLLPGQKFELKTDLVKGSIRQAGPLITQRAK